METKTNARRKETPSAYLGLSVDAPRAEWLSMRMLGITATDLVAIMGQSQYKTAFDVWCDKTMPPSDSDSAGEAAFWGTKLEEPVAQAWADKHNVKIRRVGIICNETHEWAFASLDRIVQGCPDGKCALEVKTRSLFVADAWERKLPRDVETQCQWQLLVSGLDHVHVAALIGGQKMVEHVVHPDAEYQAKMLSVASQVWEAVKSNTPPDLPAEFWSQDFLDKRHPNRDGETELPHEVTATVREYQNVLIAIKALEDRKASIRTQLVGALGDFEVALIDGKSAFTYKGVTSRRIDTKTLTALYPEIDSDDRVWNTTTTRNLRITMKDEN